MGLTHAYDLKYRIVYSSKTGNTALLAERIRDILPQEGCAFFGGPETPAAEEELLFVGFWTDKGGCDEAVSAFLKKLRNQKLFLFGTAGFGGEAEYFAQILSRVKQHVDGSNTVIGAYLCQGKMPLSVRQRYEAMAESAPDKAKVMLENFDKALPHPDAADLEGLEHAVSQALRHPALPAAKLPDRGTEAGFRADER